MKGAETMEKLLTSGEAARLLGLSAESVRAYERQGKLTARKTERGLRLFKESDIRDLAAARALRQLAQSAS